VSSFFVHNNDAQTGYILFFDLAAAATPDGDPLPDYVVGVAAGGVAQGCFCKPLMFTAGLVIAFSASSTGAHQPCASREGGNNHRASFQIPLCG
jgi:hypothetical protein